MRKLVDSEKQMTCAVALAEMESVYRCSLLTRLAVERLERKSNDLLTYYNENHDWLQTLHILLFRYIGGNDNKEPMTKMARTVTSVMCLRERKMRCNVEALLFGASGLLEGRLLDGYCRQLMNDYEYLQQKYRFFTPLYIADWQRGNIYPSANPLVRLSQLVAILCDNDVLIDSLFACKSADDVCRLFDVESSEYWAKRCGATYSDGRPPRLGKTKANMLGINVVVPFLFVYGRQMNKQAYCDQAIDLLESLMAESNKYTRFWTGYGVPMLSASDSQALLQLSTCYCAENRCDECGLGKMIYKKD
ncbi:MAG: DUF2851 family protein [Tidjanibacter sp.]|nr:DUF2851 family protein [Tidjanibacter sp.]